MTFMFLDLPWWRRLCENAKLRNSTPLSKTNKVMTHSISESTQLIQVHSRLIQVKVRHECNNPVQDHQEDPCADKYH